MNQILLVTLAALAGEFVLLVLVLLAVSFLRGRAARRRDRAAMAGLVARVTQSKPAREQAIADYLRGTLGLSGDALTQAQDALLRAELGLLQRFATIYAGRDAAAARGFDTDLYAALQAYLALPAGEGGAAPAAAPPVQDDAQAIAQLRAENASMAERLHATIATLNRTLHEYAAMFPGGAAVAPMHAAGEAGNDEPAPQRLPGAGATPRGTGDAAVAVASSTQPDAGRQRAADRAGGSDEVTGVDEGARSAPTPADEDTAVDATRSHPPGCAPAAVADVMVVAAAPGDREDPSGLDVEVVAEPVLDDPDGVSTERAAQPTRVPEEPPDQAADADLVVASADEPGSDGHGCSGDPIETGSGASTDTAGEQIDEAAAQEWLEILEAAEKADATAARGAQAPGESADGPANLLDAGDQPLPTRPGG